LKHSFTFNQQVATLDHIRYCCQCCTCFRRFFRPSSGAQTVHTAWRQCQLTHDSGGSKQAWHIPDAVCTVWAPDDERKNHL